MTNTVKEARKVSEQHFNEVSDRIQSVASDAADWWREAYKAVQERLPEGSERYLPWIAGGFAVFGFGYVFGRRNRSPVKAARKAVEGFDYEPFFQLARLWLVTRIAR